MKAAQERNMEYLDKLDAGEIDAAEDAKRRKKLKAGGLFGMLDEDNKPEKKNTRKDNSVYITGLPMDQDQDILQPALLKFMSKVGAVQKVKLYRDEEQALKGDALVIYRNEGSAMNAVRMFNGAEMLPGMPLTVSMANFGDAKAEGGGCTEAASGEVQDIRLETETDYDINTAVEKAREAAVAAEAATMEALEQGEDGVVELAKDGGISDRAKLEASLLGIVEGEADFTLVIVRHVWTPEEIIGENDLSGEGYNPGVFFCELEEELNSELGKYGGVMALAALTETEDGCIAIRYQDPVTAARGIDVMDGRGFAGRTLKAEYYDGAVVNCGTRLPRWRTGEAAPVKEEVKEIPKEPEVPVVVEPDPLPQGWKEYTTKEGRPYFNNKELGSTVWSRPKLSRSEKERLAKEKERAAKAAMAELLQM